MWKFSAVLLLAVAAAACSSRASPDASAQSTDGRRYLQALTAAIRSADRIVVTEHSFEYDAYDSEQNKSLLEEPVTYAVQELSTDQKASFETAMAGLDPADREVFTTCVFEPHHTVTFYHSGEKTSSMRICFLCGSVQWDGTSGSDPKSLVGGLARFISSIGMQPDRDWHALAREHLEQASL